MRREWSQPADDGDRLVAMGVQVAAAHGAALARYQLERTFVGRMVYFRCAESHVAPADDRRHLWARFATGGVDVVPVPGGHGQFHREPQFSAVVAELRARLRAPEPGTPLTGACLNPGRVRGQLDRSPRPFARGPVPESRAARPVPAPADVDLVDRLVQRAYATAAVAVIEGESW